MAKLQADTYNNNQTPQSPPTPLVSISLLLLIKPAFAASLAFIINHQVPTIAKLLGLVAIVFGAACGSGILDKKARKV